MLVEMRTFGLLLPASPALRLDLRSILCRYSATSSSEISASATHMLYSEEYPFQLKKKSRVPSGLTRWLRISSTSYLEYSVPLASSDSASSSIMTCSGSGGGCFFGDLFVSRACGLERRRPRVEDVLAVRLPRLPRVIVELSSLSASK